jgi:hypothetical protein
MCLVGPDPVRMIMVCKVGRLATLTTWLITNALGTINWQQNQQQSGNRTVKLATFWPAVAPDGFRVGHFHTMRSR